MNPTPPKTNGLKTTRITTQQTAHLFCGNERGQGFKKGQSGNPGGRPKGLAEMVRQITREGDFLVSTMYQIASGKLKVNGRPASHRDRMAAISWLADRGFGSKPAVEVTVNNEVTVDTGKEPEQLTIPEMQKRLADLRSRPE